MIRFRVPAGSFLLLASILAAATAGAHEAAAPLSASQPLPASSPWASLGTGMEIARFPAPPASGGPDLAVLRFDPRLWELRLLSASAQPGGESMTARQWCEREGLVAAINAGMFAADGVTHVGYLRCDGHVNSSHENAYRSAAAFDPLAPDLPPYRIFDLDDLDLDWIRERYACVAQNLRLIKRPGENRWSQQERKWSEAALAEDARGNVLFVFSRAPFTMHDFNHLLLSLPIDLVSAQHLEGGPEAQLYVRLGSFEAEWVGSHETGFMPSDANLSAWPIPNVLGVAPLDQEGR